MEWVALGVALFVVLLAGLGHMGYRKHMLQLKQWARVLSEMPAVQPHQNLEDLPEPAQRLLRHAISDDAKAVRGVSFKAVGEIRPAKDGEWLPCVAYQTLRVPGGFTWRCYVKSGLMRLSGGDHYLAGSGGVHFWLLGVFHAVKSKGRDVAKSAAHRALLEAMWLPPALLPSEHVEWLDGDNETARAKLKLDEEELVVEYKIDSDGRIVSVKGERWGDQNDKHEWQPMTFGGIMESESSVQGYTVPSKFRVGWHFGNDEWQDGEFYRAELQDIQFIE
ncbi:MAG: hypothetical protein KDB68_01700 [Planctomycetes bacterium]|nr:hypothetical protein [Planctomycetota bacterium]